MAKVSAFDLEASTLVNECRCDSEWNERKNKQASIKRIYQKFSSKSQIKPIDVDGEITKRFFFGKTSFVLSGTIKLRGEGYF